LTELQDSGWPLVNQINELLMMGGEDFRVTGDLDSRLQLSKDGIITLQNGRDRIRVNIEIQIAREP
jgi:hypothetical protein